MKNLKFTENSTDPTYRKRSFVYDFLSSMRQKINDPLGKRKKQNVCTNTQGLKKHGQSNKKTRKTN